MNTIFENYLMPQPYSQNEPLITPVQESNNINDLEKIHSSTSTIINEQAEPQATLEDPINADLENESVFEEPSKVKRKKSKKWNAKNIGKLKRGLHQLFQNSMRPKNYCQWIKKEFLKDTELTAHDISHYLSAHKDFADQFADLTQKVEKINSSKQKVKRIEKINQDLLEKLPEFNSKTIWSRETQWCIEDEMKLIKGLIEFPIGSKFRIKNIAQLYLNKRKSENTITSHLYNHKIFEQKAIFFKKNRGYLQDLNKYINRLAEDERNSMTNLTVLKFGTLENSKKRQLEPSSSDEIESNNLPNHTIMLSSYESQITTTLVSLNENVIQNTFTIQDTSLDNLKTQQASNEDFEDISKFFL
jgi:hypothetical protein